MQCVSWPKPFPDFSPGQKCAVGHGPQGVLQVSAQESQENEQVCLKFIIQSVTNQNYIAKCYVFGLPNLWSEAFGHPVRSLAKSERIPFGPRPIWNTYEQRAEERTDERKRNDPTSSLPLLRSPPCLTSSPANPCIHPCIQCIIM